MTTAPHALPPEAKFPPVLRVLRSVYGDHERPDREPLAVLVGGVLSQNTTDTNSSRAYACLREECPTWADVAEAPTICVQEAIACSGLGAQKAATIGAVMDWVRQHGGWSLDFLDEMATAEAERALTSVKGVGIKTARLTLLFGMGRPVFVVDTHVHRVARRLGLVPARCTRARAHLLLDDVMPDEVKYCAHMDMILHGRRTCRARTPLCDGCPVRRWCVHVRDPVD